MFTVCCYLYFYCLLLLVLLLIIVTCTANCYFYCFCYLYFDCLLFLLYISGVHYFMNMSQHLPCEKIYPLFLMYDLKGTLGAFGWVFQGRPNNFFSEDGQRWFYLQKNTYPVSQFILQ